MFDDPFEFAISKAKPIPVNQLHNNQHQKKKKERKRHQQSLETKITHITHINNENFIQETINIDSQSNNLWTQNTYGTS